MLLASKYVSYLLNLVLLALGINLAIFRLYYSIKSHIGCFNYRCILVKCFYCDWDSQPEIQVHTNRLLGSGRRAKWKWVYWTMDYS